MSDLLGRSRERSLRRFQFRNWGQVSESNRDLTSMCVMRWDNVVSRRDSRAFCFEIKAGSLEKVARRRRGRMRRSSSQRGETVRNGDDELVGGPMLDHQQRGPKGLAPRASLSSQLF
jgi:hypothetical protein